MKVMGNTIRRPRSRPRVKSVNFRALWWLVAREAYVQMLLGAVSLKDEADLRRVVALRSLSSLRGTAERWVEKYPQWRWKP